MEPLGVRAGELSQQVCSSFAVPLQAPCKWGEPPCKLIIRHCRLCCSARRAGSCLGARTFAYSHKSRRSSSRPSIVPVYVLLPLEAFVLVFKSLVSPFLRPSRSSLTFTLSLPFAALSLDNRSLPSSHNTCKAVYAPGIF